MIRKLLFPTTLSLLTLAAVSCGPKTPQAAAPTPAAAPAETTAAGEAADPEEAPAVRDSAPLATSAAIPEQFPDAVDLKGFGSDEPVERPDQPRRGIIVFGPEDVARASMAGWMALWARASLKQASASAERA